MSTNTRAYDVVVWGATGFTGSLVAEYFAQVLSKRHPSLRWAIGGRNKDKLNKVKQKVLQGGATDGPYPAVLVAQITDQASVDAIVSNTKVLLSTAGPFMKLGTPLVDACVRFNTHYTDITGETPWVRSIIDKYDEQAKAGGTAIVPMCGFDSIPSDIGSFFTATELTKAFGSPARSVKAYFISNGGPSGGTLASGQNMINTPELVKQFNQPFLLGGGDGGDVRQEDADVTDASLEKGLGMWTAPFGMAAINTRVARRSASLLAPSHPSLFTSDFSYNEYALAPNEKLAKKLANPPPPHVIAKLIKAGRLPAPGSGPSEAQRAKTFFGTLYVGQAADGQQLMATLQGGDPGYTETSKMVSETAIALLMGETAGRAGVLTPSVAFRGQLVTRLAKVGLEFRVLAPEAPTPEVVGKAVMSFMKPRKAQANL